MAGNLVKPTSAGSLAIENRLNPVVESKANTTAADLLQARADITHSTRIRKIFMTAKDQGKSPEEVADAVGSALAGLWGAERATEAYEAALYLADEHAQIEPGVCLVSQDTGKVLIVLRPEDIETPAPVPREGTGRLAQPLPRIRPDIEAFVTSWQFDFQREAAVCSELVARGHQTTFLREAGDPAHLVVTRDGRREIAKRYAGHTPKELLEALGGASWAFLRHLDLGVLDPEKARPEGVLVKRARGHILTPVQDIRAFNLKYDVPRGLRTSLSNGWVREIAREVARLGSTAWANNEVIKADELGPEHFGDMALFWITPPELAGRVLQAKPGVSVLVVEGAPLVGFQQAKVGELLLPDVFDVMSQELFDKWTVTSDLTYALRINTDHLKYIPVTGVVYDAFMV